MFELQFYTTGSLDWQQGCQSNDPRSVVKKFDEVVGKAVSIKLWREHKIVLELGLDKADLMKLAIWSCRLRNADQKAKERHKKLRARGLKAVQAGRNDLLASMV